ATEILGQPTKLGDGQPIQVTPVGQQPGFDVLTPGHPRRVPRLWTDNRLIGPATAPVTVDPPAGRARGTAQKAVYLRIGIDRPVEQRDQLSHAHTIAHSTDSRNIDSPATAEIQHT